MKLNLRPPRLDRFSTYMIPYVKNHFSASLIGVSCQPRYFLSPPRLLDR